MNRISAFLLLVCSVVCLAQAPQRKTSATSDGKKGTKINFHVTSIVRDEEGDGTFDAAKCFVTKFTIQGYADGAYTGSRVAYVLTCHEFLAYKPTAHVAMSCGSVHANDDYDARRVGNSISFWPEEKYTPPPFRGVYNIESEQEISEPSK
jgi:hypothetical protein